MGAVPGGVNRSAASSFHEDFRRGNGFDQDPASGTKPAKFSRGKNDIFAAAIGGDPDGAGATGDLSPLSENAPAPPSPCEGDITRRQKSSRSSSGPRSKPSGSLVA